jgi:hypothetical protein
MDTILEFIWSTGNMHVLRNLEGQTVPKEDGEKRRRDREKVSTREYLRS